MNTVQILYRAEHLGLRLEPAGDRLLVFGESCPPDFADTLRQHKANLLSWLANGQPLPPDQAGWLPVARQILLGEFDGADRSTVQSLTIGLRNIVHPLCQAALERLQRNTTLSS